MDLRRCDLGAVLGVASCISIGEYAGDDEARDGQRENQRYWGDLSLPHAKPPRTPLILLRRTPGAKAGLRASLRHARRDVLAVLER
jgi:hypothetical protein